MNFADAKTIYARIRGAYKLRACVASESSTVTDACVLVHFILTRTVVGARIRVAFVRFAVTLGTGVALLTDTRVRLDTVDAASLVTRMRFTVVDGRVAVLTRVVGQAAACVLVITFAAVAKCTWIGAAFRVRI